MEATFSSMGGLIPMWILGAPFLAGLFALMTTPNPRPSSSYPAMSPQPGR